MVTILPREEGFAEALGQALGGYAGSQLRSILDRRAQQQKAAGIQKFMSSPEYQDMPLAQKASLTTTLFGSEAGKAVIEEARLEQQERLAELKIGEKEVLTPSQRAQQVNKIADSQRNLILNNFRGPLGEIRFTGKEGQAAKKALQQIERKRQMKIKAIFGKRVPEEFQEEFEAADEFFAGDFMELPTPEPEKETGGFFSKLFGKWKKKRESPSRGKPLTKSDIDRIAKEVRQSNPGATPQQLQEIATKKAKDEGFEF